MLGPEPDGKAWIHRCKDGKARTVLMDIHADAECVECGASSKNAQNWLRQ